MGIALSFATVSIDDLRKFSVEEFDRLLEAEIFDEDERVELLDGVVVAMSPIGTEHAACVLRLTDVLSARLAGRALVSIQSPIATPRSRPLPDVALLRRRADYYRSDKPGPHDVLLLIEVADTSLARDRGLKLRLYGQARVPQTWVVDLRGRAVISATRPGTKGYLRVTTHRAPAARLVVPGFPDVVLTVEDILGPASTA